MQGCTALYDAIVASAAHLKNNPRLDKKVLLVITDGQDNMSQETLQEAARRLQQGSGPTLYAIGLMGGICPILAMKLCKDSGMGRCGGFPAKPG
jgi:Ca-activated chloride channel homolog